MAETGEAGKQARRQRFPALLSKWRLLARHWFERPMESAMRDVKMLMDGIVLGECPRWHDGRLWFSDWGGKEMIAVAMDGRHEVIERVDALPFSFDWQPDW